MEVCEEISKENFTCWKKMRIEEEMKREIRDKEQRESQATENRKKLLITGRKSC